MNIVRSKWIRWGAAGVVAVLMAGFAVGSIGGDEDQALKATGASRALAGGGDGFDGAMVEPMAAPEVGAAVAEDAVGFGSTGTTQVLQSDGFGDRVIRDARLTVEVDEGSFDDAWTAAMRIAREAGGEVISSQRGTDGPMPFYEDGRPTREVPFGTITIRVPSSDLDRVTGLLRDGIGEVRSESTSSQDVSEEFVDLQARLRNLKTEEGALLDLFARAKNVRDTLAVRERLSQVRGEIEQVSGRIRFIESRTEFSTIALTLTEPGGFVVPGDDDGPSFAQAWQTAVDGLVRIGTTAMIALIWLAPFALLAALVLGLRRRPAPPAPTA